MSYELTFAKFAAWLQARRASGQGDAAELDAVLGELDRLIAADVENPIERAFFIARIKSRLPDAMDAVKVTG